VSKSILQQPASDCIAAALLKNAQKFRTAVGRIDLAQIFSVAFRLSLASCCYRLRFWRIPHVLRKLCAKVSRTSFGVKDWHGSEPAE
jgi:hypothetical protein